MGKTASPRKVGDKEALAIGNTIRGSARKLNLDRHWRNARTLASHNPLDYKAHAVGNYLVNEVSPPANGYF